MLKKEGAFLSGITHNDNVVKHSKAPQGVEMCLEFGFESIIYSDRDISVIPK